MKGDPERRTNKLNAEQVLAGSNAGRHVEVSPAVVGDHVINTPLPCLSVESVISNLEPLLAGDRCSCSIVDLGQVGHDGALV